MEVLENEDSYCIGHHTGEQRSQSTVKNKAGIEKLGIGTRSDSNGNDPGTN